MSAIKKSIFRNRKQADLSNNQLFDTKKQILGLPEDRYLLSTIFIFRFYNVRGAWGVMVLTCVFFKIFDDSD